jgi:hypothetical protein
MYELNLHSAYCWGRIYLEWCSMDSNDCRMRFPREICCSHCNWNEGNCLPRVM